MANILLFQPVFGQKEIIKTIYFKSNSYRIDSKYYPTLNELAKKCGADTSYYMRIFGYADPTGSEKMNDELSGKRVSAVYDYLISRKIVDSTKIYTTWLGESDDAYDLHFPQAHTQERCVDIWIMFFKKKLVK